MELTIDPSSATMATPISSTNISIANAPTWRSSTRTTGDGRPGLPSDSGAASITSRSDSSSPTRPAIALRVRPVAATSCDRDDGPVAAQMVEDDGQVRPPDVGRTDCHDHGIAL